MKHPIAARMDQLVPSGIRKVNERALAMERAGEKVLHFEIGRPDFDTPAYIKRAAMNKIHQHNTTCAPSFVQWAAIAALRDEGDEVEEMVREYQRRRDCAVKAINDIPGLSCLCPKGAFYIFINCKALGRPSAELAQYLLEKAKIALVPGDVFGRGGEGYLRMSFANSYETIVEGCRRLAEAAAALRK